MALWEHEATLAEYLEPGQYYVLAWPPEGSPYSGGDWVWPEIPECGLHDVDEQSAECPHCRAVLDG